MPDVIGTTVSLSSFLQKERLTIVIDSSLHGRQEIVLSENREYIIPSFQREIRWGIENVNILLSDLDKGAIFLGNFILTIKDGGNCEIIDGQQRTTVLVLLLTWLKEKYRDELEIPVACKINNLSFPGFQTIVDVGFDEAKLSPEVFAEIIAKDVYSQYPRIKKIWDLFNNSPILSTRHKVVHVIDNLKQSQVNIITNRSNENGNSIRYFLDVNLKGIHLDTEDIFKAYLIKQDSSDEIKKLWEKNKEAARKVNLAKGGKEDSRYPLMKIYEHFLYCDLYLAEQKKFANVTFGENFCLSKNISIDGFEFYEGTHIIEVISNKAYMKNALSRINSALSIMNNVIETDGPSDPFRRLFASSEQRVDPVEIAIFHSLLKKIILDSDVIPKVLALKYIITYLDDGRHAIKEYQTLYSVFAAAVIFATFSFKKKNDIFYGFIKNDDWIERINKWLYEYASSPDLTKGKVVAAYQCNESSGDLEAQIRCKSLAAIYDFFVLKKEGERYSLAVKQTPLLRTFLHNSEEFSVEHLIISESKALQIKTERYDFPFKYPPNAAKCMNSLFNYVFIPEGINSELHNDPIRKKAAFACSKLAEIKCEYSKACIQAIAEEGTHFPKYPSEEIIDSYCSEAEVKEYLTDYFQNTFPSEFYDFALWRARQINWIER